MLPAWSGDDIRAFYPRGVPRRVDGRPPASVGQGRSAFAGRAALLHDYFLYDWHDWDDGAHRLHGFTHGQAALRNAVRDFRLNAIERDSIACHMFPMTLKPPSYIEGYLVTMADKISATRETFSLERFSKPQLESGKPLAAIESGASAASAHDGRHKPSRSREVLA